MVERRIQLPGFELHVLEAGEGKPLLLLHGWPQHSGMWDPLVEELEVGYRVLAPDLRGFGRSDAPAGDYGKHALAEDILALLDIEGIERAAIVGHDWGGWIAWLLALEHPERVERFAALDIPPPRGTSTSVARLPRQLLSGTYQVVIASPLVGERLVRRPRAIRSFIQAGTGPRTKLPDRLLDSYARAMADPASARASVALYRTFLLRELPSVVLGTYTEDELTVPGLVIMGSESGITKALGLPAEEPGLAVETIPGVGHFLVDEAPEQVLAVLRPFLAQA